jgi:hypothetical protein
MDDYPGRGAVFALWDDYFQPERRRTGKGDGGFAELVYVLAGERRSIDLPAGYAFVSYHMRSDGRFVHDRLRPVLA